MDRRDTSGKTPDDVRVESHADEDPEDANCQSSANDGVTDYENDDLSNNDDHMIASNSPSDNQLPVTELASGLMAVNSRGGALVDHNNGQSVPGGRSPVANRTNRTAEFALMDDMTRRGPVDGNHEAVSNHPSSHGPSVSPNEDFDDDRDPNYATQRPDTLGAINVASAGASAFAGAVARPVYQLSAAVRAWPVESVTEDASFTDDGTAHLGRRTCGAGMDQLELNQRQLMDDDLDDENGGSDDDADDSELCDDDDDDDDDDDIGLGSGTQCESTEADQYKMDPEADQSTAAVELSTGHSHVVSEPLQQTESVPLSADMRSGACGFSLGHRRQTDGALSDVSHSMDDPEEDQADRASSVENTRLEPAASLSVQKPLDAAHAVSAACDEHKHAALKQHPQSAFSIPKPRVSKSKPGQSDAASCSNRPVPSVRQSKSNTDIVFKPINSSVGKSSLVPRTLMTSKGSDGFNVTGMIHGELADRRQLSAQDCGVSCRDKKDTGVNVELDFNKPVHCVNSTSGRSVWSREPVWNSMDQPVVVWNDAHTSSSVSCHLPGEGGAIAVGTFAPANGSSQQATPQKSDTHACCVLNSSLDISPIQPASSSSSRPLSMNGLHPVDSASISGTFPGTEFYLGTQAMQPHFSHKVKP